MKSWLQLFRVPNLFTVPGDPLAGWLLASGAAATLKPQVFLVLAASLAFYSFGLGLNDLMDLREDQAERPTRPLPSGAVNPAAAWKATIFLLVLGLVLCACSSLMCLYCGIALAAAIFSYNYGMKRIATLGPVNMGICRGLNILLGAALTGVIPIPSIAAAVFVTTYITAVTTLARVETSNPAIPPLIGKLIRALVPIQTVFCLISCAGMISWISATVLVLVLWPLSRVVGKKFYAS